MIHLSIGDANKEINKVDDIYSLNFEKDVEV